LKFSVTATKTFDQPSRTVMTNQVKKVAQPPPYNDWNGCGSVVTCPKIA
jgi:hypothetical protein